MKINSYYQKSVAVFGLVLPLLVFCLLIGAALYYVSSINKKFQIKQRKYNKSQVEERAITALEKRAAENSSHLQNWQEILDKETRGTFVEHWKTAEKKFSGQEFSRAPHNWVNYSAGLGKGVAQSASQVEMNFTGTFRAMQLALMEVESKLPQLQLDSLSIAPHSSKRKLNFTTQFTVWTKN